MYSGTDEYGECLHLRTNDRQQPRATISGRARVLRAVRVEAPASQGDCYAPLLPRNAGAQVISFTLRRGDGGPIDPRVAAIVPWVVNSPAPGQFNVDGEVRMIEAGERYQLLVIAAPPWPDASLSGQVVFDTGVAEQPRYDVTFHVHMPLRLQYDGSRLRVPANRAADLVLTTALHWSEDAPAPGIRSVNGSLPGLSGEVLTEDGRQTLRVTVSPECLPPENAECGLLVLHTDDPFRPEEAIGVCFDQPTTASRPWRGGDVRVEPASWEVGTVWQGADLRAEFRVQNGGEQPFEARAWGRPCAYVVAPRLHGMLAPGEVWPVQVRFDTSQVGAQTGRVEFGANSWNGKEISLDALVKPTHELRPGRILSFGDGGAAWTASQSVELVNLYTEPMSPSVASVRSWPPEANYGVQIEALEPGRRFRVTVTPREPVPDRYGVTLIELDTGWAELPNAKVRLYVLANEARAHAERR